MRWPIFAASGLSQGPGKWVIFPAGVRHISAGLFKSGSPPPHRNIATLPAGNFLVAAAVCWGVVCLVTHTIGTRFLSAAAAGLQHQAQKGPVSPVRVRRGIAGLGPFTARTLFDDTAAPRVNKAPAKIAALGLSTMDGSFRNPALTFTLAEAGAPYHTALLVRSAAVRGSTVRTGVIQVSKGAARV